MNHLTLMKVAFVVRPGRDPDGHDHLGEALGRRAALRRSYGGCGYGSLSRIGLHRMNGGIRRRFVGGLSVRAFNFWKALRGGLDCLVAFDPVGVRPRTLSS